MNDQLIGQLVDQNVNTAQYVQQEHRLGQHENVKKGVAEIQERARVILALMNEEDKHFGEND